MALLMVSSLRSKMRLKQIYDLLMLIQEESTGNNFTSENIAINLSMEASLLFLRTVDENAYLSLVVFALLPAGITDADCATLFGNQWDEYKQMLLSKSLILKRASYSQNSKQCDAYRIETTFQNFVLARASQDEIKHCEQQVLEFIVGKIRGMLNEKCDDELVRVEGNAFEMLDRLKHKLFYIQNSDASDHDKQDNKSDEDSWADSEEERDLVPHAIGDQGLSVQPPMRLSTYQQRRQKALSLLCKEEEKSLGTESDLEESDLMTESIEINSSDIPCSININDEGEMKANENTKKEKKQTLQLINQLISRKSVNVTSNLLQNMTHSLLNGNYTKEINDNITIEARRPIETDGILIEPKDSTYPKFNKDQTMTSLVSLFNKNKKSTINKKGRSSVVQFLIDQNLWQENKTDSMKNFYPESVCSTLTKSKTDTSLPEAQISKWYKPVIQNEEEVKVVPKQCQKWKNLECSQGSMWGMRESITIEGKFMVLFSTLMILSNNYIGATKVIEEYGFKYRNDKFSLASMHKLFGMIFIMEEDRSNAIKHIDKALALFKKMESIHGQAVAYYLKSYALKIDDYEDDYNNFNKNNEAKMTMEKSMMFYKLLKHREGFIKAAKE